MAISAERLHKALTENAPSYLHADTEIRRICRIIATTQDDMEGQPRGGERDAILLESEHREDERQYYYASERMLLLERCEHEIGARVGHILDLEIEALQEDLRSHGITWDEDEE